MAKDRGKETLSTQVDAATYWKFLFLAESKGQTISERLRELVLHDIEKRDELTTTAERKELELGITERQKNYIFTLYEILKENVPDDVSALTIGEADKRIKELRDKVSKRSRNND